jgi:ribosomal protein S20
MSRLRVLGFAGAIVIATLVGGTIMSAVAAAPMAEPVAVDAAPAAPDAAAGEYCTTYRAALAANLHVTEDELAAAARQAATTTIDKAVADGDLAKAVGDRLKARIAAAPQDLCQRIAKRIEQGVKPALGVVRDAMDAAADALGMTRADLRTQLLAGTSLKTIASAKGVAYATVTTAVLAAVKQDLDAAVSAGTLAQARADRVLGRLTERLADGQLRRAP